MKTQLKHKVLSNKAIMLAVLLLLFSINLSFAQSGWFLINSGVDTNYAWDWTSFVNSSTGYAVGSEMIGGIMFPRVIKTTNGGVNWNKKSTLLEDSAYYYFRNVLFTNANTGFITAGGNLVNPSIRGKILKTTNGGEDWYNIPLPVDKHMTMLFFINASTGYATGHQTILKTTNTGETWVLMTSGVGYLFAINFTDVNTGYIVGNSGWIYKTTEGGITWTSSSYTPIHLWGLWFINSNTGFAVGGNDISTPNIILKTTNAGNNWDTVPHAYPTGPMWSVRFTSPDTGYISCVYRILKTINGGLNWYSLNLPVDTNNFLARNCYFTNANTGYLAGHDANRSYGYILKTTTGGELTGIKPVSNEVPAEYMLEQNYPNPFNPVTSIKFKVASVGHPDLSGQTVTLKVFDLLGKEVATLVNEKLQPGTYEVTFDAGNLPSGVYFYKLETEVFTDTKKMLMIK